MFVSPGCEEEESFWPPSISILFHFLLIKAWVLSLVSLSSKTTCPALLILAFYSWLRVRGWNSPHLCNPMNNNLLLFRGEKTGKSVFWIQSSLLQSWNRKTWLHNSPQCSVIWRTVYPDSTSEQVCYLIPICFILRHRTAEQQHHN